MDTESKFVEVLERRSGAIKEGGFHNEQCDPVFPKLFGRLDHQPFRVVAS